MFCFIFPKYRIPLVCCSHVQPRWQGLLNGTQYASKTQPGHKNCTAADKARGRCSIGEGGDPLAWGQLWSEHPQWYLRAWEKWINTSIADAPDEVLIPKCPDGKEKLVHDWHN